METVLTFWATLAGGVLILMLGFAAAAYRHGLRDGLLWGRSPFPEATPMVPLHDSLWEVRLEEFDASGKQHPRSSSIVRLRQFDSRLVGEPEAGSSTRWSCEAVAHGYSLHLLTATSTPKGKRFASAQLECQPDGSFTGFEIGRIDGEPGMFVRSLALIPRDVASAGSPARGTLPNFTACFENGTSPGPALRMDRAISGAC